MLNGFVFIIESPSAEDILDGRTEGRALNEVLRIAGTDNYYSLAISREMFCEALRNRLQDALQYFPEKNPILHISAHGNPNGIGFSNGDYVEWNELRAALAPLNNAMQGGLLICMSSCFGSSGCRMAMNEQNDQPFGALVGNTSNASWADASVAYVAFYHRLFRDGDLEASVEAMKVASGDDNFLCWYGHAVKEDWANYMSQTRRDALAHALTSARGSNSLVSR